MMLKIIGISLVAVILILLLKRQRPDIALLISIACGGAILLLIVGEVGGVLGMIKSAANKYGMDTEFIPMIIKVIGVAYMAQLASQLCSDAGEGAIGAKIELGARIAILAIALPTAFKIIEVIMALMPTGVA